jgi:hypothetical protein
MFVTYKTSKVQSKLISNGRSLIPVTFNICCNAPHNVTYHSWVLDLNFLFNRVNFNSRLPPTSLSQPSSPPHPPPPRSGTLARVLPAVVASVNQDSRDLHTSMPWRPPAASGPRQRVSIERSAPCAATPPRQIRVLAGHGAPSRPDLSSLAPKLLPPLLLHFPPSPPLSLFDLRDRKLTGAGGAGSSSRSLGSRCAAAEEQPL